MKECPLNHFIGHTIFVFRLTEWGGVLLPYVITRVKNDKPTFYAKPVKNLGNQVTAELELVKLEEGWVAQSPAHNGSQKLTSHYITFWDDKDLQEVEAYIDRRNER